MPRPFAERYKLTFDAPDVVRFYTVADALQRPEDSILTLLRERLRGAAILDVGVGGGRTTLHFAPLARRYVGIDYSAAMIQACRRRFAGTPYEFRFANAADLACFDDGTFDFVLFSHNGIDCVTYEDRLRILGELRRVLVPGGILCFSSHNLQRTRDLFLPNRAPGNVLGRMREVIRVARVRAHNPWRELLDARDHAVLNDGAFNYRVATYHITPEAQLAQLRACALGEVRVFSFLTGQELMDIAARAQARDPWLYYLATKPV